ncbi:MAG: trimethylamine methyltransferase family protein [Bacillota bacterium]|nr:trimethylamine methyltransferase family protein [Bacillota bacterium]
MQSKLSLLTESEQQCFHEKTLELLENIGVVVGSKAVCDMLAKKGAKVVGENVRFPKKMMEELLELRLKKFPLGAYNEENRLTLPSVTHPYSSTAGYVPYIYDEDTGKNRYSTTEDLVQLCKLADYSREMDCFWPLMMPAEYNGELQEFKATEIALRHIGKHTQCSSASGELAEYQVAIAQTIAGGSKEFRENPILSLLSAPTTPLAIEGGIADAICVSAKNGVPILPMSLPQMTTTSPATFAAAVLLVNAEVLACYAVAKCAADDARVFYSYDAGAPNLFDGGIDYENSEYVLLSAANTDMARFYEMPGAMGCSVEYKDFSTVAGFERNIFRCGMKLMTRVDVACWIGTRESCLSSSLIDVVLDLEVCRYAKAYFRQFPLNDDTLAMEVISQRGPRGNFLDHEHTFTHFKDSIFTEKATQSFIFADPDKNYREAAKEKLDKILTTHQGPVFDEALNSELDKIAAKATEVLKDK